MDHFKLDEMIGGWLVGDFEPSVLRTKSVEIGIKRFKKGEYFEAHYHKIADEITVIIDGIVRVNGVEYGKNDIIVQHRFEKSDFKVLTDTVILAVKWPSAKDDKYFN